MEDGNTPGYQPEAADGLRRGGNCGNGGGAACKAPEPGCGILCGRTRGGRQAILFSQGKNSHIQELLSPDETAVASWSFRNNKHAGASTGTLPGAKGLYLAVRSANAVYGVVGICLGEGFLPAFDESILNAMLNEAALALEKEKSMEDRNQARLRIKQEQLRSNLLRSISHDLRTPLTSISGNSGMLMDRGTA